MKCDTYPSHNISQSSCSFFSVLGFFFCVLRHSILANRFFSSISFAAFILIICVWVDFVCFFLSYFQISIPSAMQTDQKLTFFSLLLLLFCCCSWRTKLHQSNGQSSFFVCFYFFFVRSLCSLFNLCRKTKILIFLGKQEIYVSYYNILDFRNG